MSYVFPVNPNAGGKDGDSPDPVMGEELPQTDHDDDRVPEPSGEVEVQRPHEGSSDALPYSWSDLDKTEEQAPDS